jgi:hypothetical protein
LSFLSVSAVQDGLLTPSQVDIIFAKVRTTTDTSHTDTEPHTAAAFNNPPQRALPHPEAGPQLCASATLLIDTDPSSSRYRNPTSLPPQIKSKGARRIDFKQFMQAVDLIAAGKVRDCR